MAKRKLLLGFIGVLIVIAVFSLFFHASQENNLVRQRETFNAVFAALKNGEILAGSPVIDLIEKYPPTATVYYNQRTGGNRPYDYREYYYLDETLHIGGDEYFAGILNSKKIYFLANNDVIVYASQLGYDTECQYIVDHFISPYKDSNPVTSHRADGVSGVSHMLNHQYRWSTEPTMPTIRWIEDKNGNSYPPCSEHYQFNHSNGSYFFPKVHNIEFVPQGGNAHWVWISE